MDFICGLDIDGSKIVGVLASVDHRKNIRDIYIEKTQSKGFSKGRVMDLVSFSEAISRIINNLESKSGTSIRNVFINTKGDFIKSSRVNARLPLSEANNRVIRQVDVKRVNKFARDLGLDLNEEVIFEVPHKYKVDNHDDIQEPVGLSAHRLEVELFLVRSDFMYLECTRQAFRHIGVSTSGIILSGLATAASTLDNEDKLNGATLIDIGDDLVEILNFSNNKLVDYRTLSFGYNNLCQALAEKMDISKESASQVSDSYAVMNMPDSFKDEEIVIKRDNDYKTLSKSLVSSIITEETKGMVSLIKKELLDMQGQTQNIIITGEISLIEGFIELAEASLEKPIKLGRVKDINLVPYFESIWGVRALGLVRYCIENNRLPEDKDRGSLFSDFIIKAREIYQDYF
ncbi:MAG: cell division protein FtsA [Candidatus Omnitrophota bacterium]